MDDGGLFGGPPDPPPPPEPVREPYQPTPEELARQRSAVNRNRTTRDKLVIPATPSGSQTGTGLRII